MRLPVRLGTRGSPLALAQAEIVRTALAAVKTELADPGAVEIVVIKTTGDRVQDRPLAEIGGKGLFTKELEVALLEERIDLAVHSLKDMETSIPAKLVIAAVLPREDPRDALIGAASLAALPEGAVVGTASLRRGAQVLAQRPDLHVVPMRGNVETRLRKRAEGEVAATLLALAGLRRLGLERVADAVLEPETMLPAVAQGAIGLEARADDPRTRELLALLDHAPTHQAVRAERAMLEALDGSCRTPIAGFGRLAGDRLVLDGLVADVDGRNLRRARQEGAPEEAERLGRAVAAALRA